MNLCSNCGCKTNNKRFCSKRCSATFNNKHQIKRKRSNRCVNCGELIVSNRKRCRKCMEESSFMNNTVRDVLENGNSNKKSRYPYIRQVSRRIYIDSGRGMFCHICGYDKHVDICHIKPVHKFDKDARIEEINSLSNLVALCKNHHWEFDNGLIKAPLVGLEPT